MGFIKAFSGALSGTFADQWKDFYVPQEGVPATAGLFRAVKQATNNGRGENPESRGEIHAQDWVCYYGFDFMRYSSIPLLGKVNHHGAFLASVEMGLNKSSMFYWSLSLSLIQ